MSKNKKIKGLQFWLLQTEAHVQSLYE